MTMPPAGWYPSPGEPGLLRWWDGSGWSEHRQNAELTAAPAVDDESAAADEEQSPAPARPFTVTTRSSKRSRRRTAVAVAALAFGALWFAAAATLLGTFSPAASPAKGERAAAGTVVSVVWSEGSATYSSDGSLQKASGEPACAAVVEATVDGQKFQKQETAFQAPCAVKVGDAREVFFTPENAAASLHVAPGQPRTLLQAVVPAAGLIPIAASSVLLYRRRVTS
jgi:hypothetical protein